MSQPYWFQLVTPTGPTASSPASSPTSSPTSSSGVSEPPMLDNRPASTIMGILVSTIMGILVSFEGSPDTEGATPSVFNEIGPGNTLYRRDPFLWFGNLFVFDHVRPGDTLFWFGTLFAYM